MDDLDAYFVSNHLNDMFAWVSIVDQVLPNV